MRVVYYTHTAFFDVALSLAHALARRSELHLVLEMTPQAWRQASFQAEARELPEGLIPADPILAKLFPASVRDLWSNTASFHLAVHTNPRSLSLRALLTSRRVLRFAEDISADVLHVDDVDVTPRLALALPFSRGTPLVLSVHDPAPHSSEENWRKSLSRRVAFPRAAGFVLFNEAQRHEFGQRYGVPPERVTTAHLGIFDILRHWEDGAAPPPEPATVLFFGRLSAYKGLPTFLESMQLLSERVSGLRVVIAGRPVGGYSLPPMPTLARGGTIELIERYLANAEVCGLMRRATVVACPYDDATQSGIVLTAYAFRAPVVATRVGGMPEYVVDGKTGFLVPPRDAPALAEAIERVLTQPDRAAEMRRDIEALERAELNWDRTADDLLRAYTSALTNRR